MSLRPRANTAPVAPIDIAESTDSTDSTNSAASSRLAEVLFAGMSVDAKRFALQIERSKRPHQSVAAPQPPAVSDGGVIPMQLPIAFSNPEFKDKLMGAKVVEDIMKRLYLNDFVLKSYDELFAQYVLSRAGIQPDGMETDWRFTRTWADWIDSIGTRVRFLSKGNSNSAWVIRADQVPLGVKNLYPSYGGDMVYRRSNPRMPPWEHPELSEVVEEIIISAYCAYAGVGPKIFATWIKTFDDLMELNKGEIPTLRRLSEANVRYYNITEAWTGDLVRPLQSMIFPPEVFAEKFSRLLGQTTAVGLWQLDAKPSNMLFRGDAASGDFELAWTDFDGTWCSIWPPDLRTRYGKCSILVHTALVMGYISCNLGEAVFRHYQPALLEQLRKDHDIDAVSDTAMCEWIDGIVPQLEEKNAFRTQQGRQKRQSTEREKLSTADTEADKVAKLRITQRLHQIMWHYLTKAPSQVKGDQRCMLSTKIRKPSFVQMYTWSMEKAGRPEVEEWSRLFSPSAPPFRPGM